MELQKEQKLAQLERILQSRALHNSESLKAFLRFVVEKTVENEGVQLKEYVIATEVFGRNSDYDSRIDSVVRVQAGRLRAKLQEYYATEGKADQIVIDLPKGHYHPVFTRAHSEAANAPPGVLPIHTTEEANGHAAAAAPAPDRHAGVDDAPARRPSGRLTLLLGSVIVVLCVAVVALALWNRELQRQTERAAAASFNSEEFGAVWGPFLNDPEPPLLVLSNPAVYRFINRSDPDPLKQRALNLAPEQVRQMTEAPEFKGQYPQYAGQAPQLIPSLGMYTGMGEAIGLYRLTDLFSSANRDILLKQSRFVSASDLKYKNVILLGSIYVNEWSRKLPAGERFSYTYSATIENREPQPGEEHIYRPQFDEQTGELREDYALITVKPNVSGEHAVMILAGIYSEGTEAAAEFITTRSHLGQLAQRLRELGGEEGPPKYYQALLKVGVENGTPTTITLVALHPLGKSGG
jgi:hypothetical protein